jgi:hypothetical protein
MTDQSQQAGQPAPQPQPPPGVRIVDLGAVFQNFEARIQSLETKAKAEVESFASKYWPLGVGLLIAATRFIH